MTDTMIGDFIHINYFTNVLIRWDAGVFSEAQRTDTSLLCQYRYPNIIPPIFCTHGRTALAK